MMTREVKWSNVMIFFQNCSFRTYSIEKNHHFWVHDHSSWFTFDLLLVHRPQMLCKLDFQEFELWKLDYERWSDFMVHGLNRPLVPRAIKLAGSIYCCKLKLSLPSLP